MRPSANTPQHDAVERLFRNLVARGSEFLFDHPSRIQRLERLCPDRMDEIRTVWDELGRAAEAYLVGRLPWNGVAEAEREIIIPGASMRRIGSDLWEPLRCRVLSIEFKPDVMTLASDYFVLTALAGMEFGDGY